METTTSPNNSRFHTDAELADLLSSTAKLMDKCSANETALRILRPIWADAVAELALREALKGY